MNDSAWYHVHQCLRHSMKKIFIHDQFSYILSDTPVDSCDLFGRTASADIKIRCAVGSLDSEPKWSEASGGYEFDEHSSRLRQTSWNLVD